MTRLVQGIEIEQNLVRISGSAEISDEQVDTINQGGTIELTLRGHVKGRTQEPGGQNTKPRETIVVSLDALDVLREGDDVDGQMKIGNTPPDPDDAA